jgi:hypothetical protein
MAATAPRCPGSAVASASLATMRVGTAPFGDGAGEERT